MNRDLSPLKEFLSYCVGVNVLLQWTLLNPTRVQHSKKKPKYYIRVFT
jgi:hypothetical protein